MIRSVLASVLFASVASAQVVVVPTYDVNAASSGYWFIDDISVPSPSPAGVRFLPASSPMYIRITLNLSLITPAGGWALVNDPTSQDVYLAPVNGSASNPSFNSVGFNSSSVNVNLTLAQSATNIGIGGVIAGVPVSTGGVITLPYGQIYAAPQALGSFTGTYSSVATTAIVNGVYLIGTYEIFEGLPASEGSSTTDFSQLINVIETEFEDLGVFLDQMMRDPTTEQPYLSLILQELQQSGPVSDYTDQLDALILAQNIATLSIGSIGQLLTSAPVYEDPSTSQFVDDIGTRMTDAYDFGIQLEDSFMLLPEDGLPNDSFRLDLNMEQLGLNAIGPINFPDVQFDVDLSFSNGPVTILRTFILFLISVFCAMRLFEEVRRY